MLANIALVGGGVLLGLVIGVFLLDFMLLGAFRR